MLDPGKEEELLLFLDKSNRANIADIYDISGPAIDTINKHLADYKMALKLLKEAHEEMTPEDNRLYQAIDNFLTQVNYENKGRDIR